MELKSCFYNIYDVSQWIKKESQFRIAADWRSDDHMNFL
jgi:hypothetical protein